MQHFNRSDICLKNSKPGFNALFNPGNKRNKWKSSVWNFDHLYTDILLFPFERGIGPRKSIFTRWHKEFQLKVPLPSSRQLLIRGISPPLFPPTFIVAAVISRISARTKVIDCAESKEEEEVEEESSFKAFQISNEKIIRFYFSTHRLIRVINEE